MAVGKKRKKDPDKGGEWRETVVKCCLTKHLRAAQTMRHIERYVRNSSRIFHTGSLLANHFVCDMIRTHGDGVDVKHLHEMVDDQMFFYRAFAIVARSKQEGKLYRELSDFYDSKRALYPGEDLVKRLEGDSPILNAAARQLATNAATYLRTTFASRLMKVVYARLPEGTRSDVANSVCWRVRGMTRYARCPLDSEQEEVVFELRRLVAGEDVAPDVEINDKWLDRNKGRVVVFYGWILNNFEELKRRNPRGLKRRFNLLPVAAQKNHFVAISSVVLRQLMVDSGMFGVADNGTKRSVDQGTFNGNLDGYRDAVFATSLLTKRWKKFRAPPDASGETPLEIGAKKFGNTIETDGVSVCFHVLTWAEKASRQEGPPKPKKCRKRKGGATVSTGSDDFRRPPDPACDVTDVVGVDPGRCNISSTVQKAADGSWKKCRLTKGQFYRDSHVERNLKKLQRMDRACIPSEMSAMSERVSKTASVEEFEEYLMTKRRVDPRLWEHRQRRCFALMAMDNFIHKRKTMDRFWKRTVGLKEHTIVAYGDAGFASSGRGERSVPTVAMRQAARRFSRRVVEVDEFRTSKTCCDCGAVLLPVRVPGKTKPLRAVRRCGSIECNEAPLKSRDWSAAINILWRFVDPRKVPWLERCSADERPNYTCHHSRASNPCLVRQAGQ
jgi:hypothetical protein